MKTLLLTCLVLINCSCGKKKNDFSKRYQFSSIESDTESVKESSPKQANPPKQISSQEENEEIEVEVPQKIMQIAVPSLKLLNSKFILSNHKSIAFKSHRDAKNLFLRQGLIKLIAKNFRNERVKTNLTTAPSFLILDEKQLYKLRGDQAVEQDIIRYDQFFEMRSPKKSIQFKKVQASLGSPQNVIDRVSLSQNQQEIDEVITHGKPLLRSFKASYLKHTAIKQHLEKKNPVHVFLNDYFIIESGQEFSYQEKRELLLNKHYELVISTNDKTEIYYVPATISFAEALNEISDKQIIIDQSFQIASLLGKLNSFPKAKDIDMNSSFIKLINFQQQNLKETPKAGNSYAVVQFQLKEVQSLAPVLTKISKTHHFSDLKPYFTTKIQKNTYSSLATKMVLERKDYKIVKQTINAYVFILKGFGLKKKKCKVYKYTRSLASKRNISVSQNLSFMIGAKSVPFDRIYTGQDRPLLYAQVNFKAKSLNLRLKKSTKSLTEKVIEKCPRGVNNMILDAKTDKPIKLHERKAPAHDYTLKLEVTERGNIY